jgi:hypothetical protein
VAFGIGMVAAGVAWVVVEELPASSPWTGGSIIFSGLVVLATMGVSLWQAKQARDAGEPTAAELLKQRHAAEHDGDGHASPERVERH